MTRSMHHLGFTRSTSRREYLLQTPDAQVRTPLPGLTHGTAVMHAAPEMGAGFAMYTLELAASGQLTHAPAQRLLYVLEGQVQVALESGERHTLGPRGFCFVPAGAAHTLAAQESARVVLFEKPRQQPSGLPLPAPSFLIGHEPELQATALNDDPGVQVRALLPPKMAFDFAVNTMSYVPGASLSQVEVHYMEHGLLMLEGEGLYRLGDDWHPVQAGDAIWMAPFCPQWFAALGKSNAKYLIYKNFNRHVLA